MGLKEEKTAGYQYVLNYYNNMCNELFGLKFLCCYSKILLNINLTHKGITLL